MDQPPSLSHKKHREIDKNHRLAAKAARLRYMTDRQEGIRRVKKGKGYTYSLDRKPVHDSATLERIRKLAIPPSWEKVWISPDPTGHIQATGLDLNGRKQYRYHTDWNMLRNETKFHRLLEFGKVLPLLRKKANKDIAKKELTADKVVATAIRLMEETCIRVGNNGYEKLYGSYGLTTLKDKHVIIKDRGAMLSFKGKKGIQHNISLHNRKLARLLKQCRDIPGKELFQYYDKDGSRKSIDSGMVNSYIKEATGDDFSAKDFRTWAGSLQAIECFRAAGEAINASEAKQNIVAVLDAVSSKLGNTRSVCKKYYVHPLLIRLYEENKLLEILKKDSFPQKLTATGLTEPEKTLLRVLKSYK